MNIHVDIVEPSQMRPEVDGVDWFFDDKGDLQVRIAPMSDWRYETALALHEVFEACLAKHQGITVAQVDAFDQQYDKTHSTDCNAGDDPQCPYRKEHCLATAVERILAAELDVCWESYDRELAESYPGPRHKKNK